MAARYNRTAIQRQIPTFCWLIIGAFAIWGCTSSYERASQKLAAGDYGGAREIVDTLPDNQQTEHLRRQIDNREAHAKAGAATSALVEGSYVRAHELYEQASNYARSAGLRSDSEIADGLCITEHKIGPPTYPLQQQRDTCTKAIALAGSGVEPTLRRIDTKLSARYLTKVRQAVAAKNVNVARDFLAAYSRLSVADRRTVSGWTANIDQLQRQQELEHQRAEEARARSSIERIRRRYPAFRRLTAEAFADLIVTSYTNGLGTPYFSDAKVNGGTLTLIVPNADVRSLLQSQAALDQINDEFVSWCDCAGETEIEGEYFGRRLRFPISVRFDAEAGHSVVSVGQ
jgi:hypothetical protein